MKLNTCIIITIFVFTPFLYGLQFRAFDPNRHSRIVDGIENPQFLFYNYDAFGIAVSQDSLIGASRAVLISRKHFVTTSHTENLHPNNLTFVGTDGIPREYEVLRYEVVPNSTDLTLGRLVRGIPEDIPINPLPLALGKDDSFIAATIGIFGFDNRAGINRFESGGASNDLIGFNFDPPDSSLFGRGRDEAVPVMGDSGHALVAAYKGQLFALGVHYTSSSSQALHSHSEYLQEQVEADGYTLNFVDRLPRLIADFDLSTSSRIWKDEGVDGGTIPSQGISPEPVGRIQNTVGDHHLIATASTSRPLLVRDEDQFPFLVFEAEEAILAIDSNIETFRGFPFELNTEQPRFTFILRVPSDEVGYRPIAEVSYTLPANGSMFLGYDYSSKELVAGWKEREFRISAPENEWMLVEWYRQREWVRVTINGNRTESLWIHPEYNQDTQFSRLRVGGNADHSAAGPLHLARLIIEDSGDSRSEQVILELIEQYLRDTIHAGKALELSDENQLVYTVGVESGNSISGGVRPYYIWPDAVEVVDGIIRVDFEGSESSDRVWRLNKGASFEISDIEDALLIKIQVSQDLTTGWRAIDLDFEDASLCVSEGRIGVTLPESLDHLGKQTWLRAVLRGAE